MFSMRNTPLNSNVKTQSKATMDRTNTIQHPKLLDIIQPVLAFLK